MKIFETKITCMGSEFVIPDKASGMPNNIYPNTDVDGYHDFYELELHTEGKGLHYINGVPFEVKENYIYLLFPGEYHHKHLDESTHFNLYNLKFDTNVISADLMKDISAFKHPLCVYLDESEAEIIKSEFELFLSVRKNKLYNVRMERNIAERILNIFLCALEKGIKPAAVSSHEPIWDIVKYIEKNYNKDISLNDIATRLGVSENYSGIYFKKHTNMSFVNYLNKIRLFHALPLLKNTDKTIKEVAFLTGFNSPEYFSRVFTETFMISPKNYRKENKQKD